MADLVAMCDADISMRSLGKARVGRSGKLKPLRDLERESSEKLGLFAKALSKRYDLSAKTAKSISAGVKGFKAHGILSIKGEVKVGGLQRSGKVALSRYISYRIKDTTVSLTIFLMKDRPIDEAIWLVLGPEHAGDVHQWRPISELPGSEFRDAKGAERGGTVLYDFEESTRLFESLIAALAPKSV